MKTVLITGGAGFIGSHLCDFFLSKGYRVICADNFITGKMENLPKSENFSLIQHDVTKPLYIDEEIHYILHFASPASPKDYERFPIQTLKVGSLGTHNMLGLAKKKNCSFLLASTSEVYGDPLINPQPESYRGNVNQVGPRGVYDEAKRFAEAIVTAYHKVHGIDVKIARIFNTYGPRMRKDDGRVIPNFIMQALQGKPLTIYGNGKQTRSFCYISDMIDGIYKLLLSECNEPVNLGNPESISVLELADLVIKIVGSRSGKVFLPLPEDDPKLRCPDISKARKIIGWEPRVSLEEGIRNTVDYFRKLSSCY